MLLHDLELAGEDGNGAELFLLLAHQLRLVLREPGYKSFFVVE